MESRLGDVMTGLQLANGPGVGPPVARYRTRRRRAIDRTVAPRREAGAVSWSTVLRAATCEALDRAVKAAHANRTQVTLVLGLSPAYAAPTPTDPPNLAMYKAFLTAVMRRYRPAHWGYRGIAAYQVWNEVNIKTFWTGTVSQAVALTKAAYDVRNHVDKGALLVAPAMVARLKHYFATYKSMVDEQPQVTLESVYGADHACRVIRASMEDYDEEFGRG